MTINEIQDGIFAWIDNVKPSHDTVDIDLDADLVSGNQITVTLNGSTLTPVNFTIDHETTMNLISAGIEAQASVYLATVLPIDTAQNRRIRVKGIQNTELIIDSVGITGGASQPGTNITRTARTHDVSWVEQNAPIPSDQPYITLQTNSLVGLGQGYESQPDAATGIVTRQQDREFTLMLRGYGSTAYQDMLDILDSIDIEENEQILYDNGLIVFDNEAVMDLSAVLGTKYIDQAGIDFMMRYGHTISDSGRGEITSSTVTGQLTEGTSTIDTEVTIEKP